MSKTSMRSFELGRAISSTPMIDTYALVPILACVYAAIVGHLVVFASAPVDIQSAEPGLPNRIFWPAMAAVSVVVAVRNYSPR